ncbi:TSUP family transporter [Lacticaseibacillus thailandensis]|nr:TSUP family transporter [Lacticaseibacillus thailandensis]
MQYRGHAPRHIVWPVAVVFMIVSGFFNGLFGIGGPLMALYFLTESRSTTEYLASIQTFFMLDTVYVTSLRFSQGILQLHHLGFVAVGMLGAVIGTIVANRVVDQLNLTRVRQIVYTFIGISGLYYLVQALV